MLVALSLCAATVAIALSAWEYLAARRVLDRVQSELHLARSASERQRTAPVPATLPRLSAPQAAAINGAIARLNIPWNELLTTFEVNRTPDVGLLALTPDARRHRLTVHAEARNPRAMIDFAEQLRAQDHVFDEASLARHERRDQEPGHPYRFAVEVRWKEER